MAGQDGGAGRVERKGSRDPLVGTVINGKFRVDRAIARGGMGRIYYGTQAPLDRPVALKIVKADSVNEEESQFLKRFLLEASILAKLQHPNVVTLFDYGRIEGASVEMYFIAMEYLDGETLTERLRTRGALPTFEALALFRQIGRGLREAHMRGIVHRDLKPSNIVIVPEADGEIVKLVDFGIGKDERGGEDLTRDGVLVGTPKYMAPEQFDGASSSASDVYALGIIVYQLLTGSLPFAGSSMADFMIAKLQHAVPPMREVNPICDVTESLESLVYRMLARHPQERPTLDEVFAQLAHCEEEIYGSSGARLALTGHLGFATSSRPLSIGGLPVSHTVIAPQPALHTPRPAGGNTTSGPPITVLTPRPMATSARPETAGRASFPVAALVALLLMLTSAGAAGLWFAKTHLFAKDDVPADPTQAASATSSAAAASATATATAAPTSFVLHLDSTPSGATVLEDGKVLGETPLDVPIDRSSVANGAARGFQLKMAGYTTTAFAQGSSEADVAHTVPLAPETARTVKSGPSHASGGSKSPANGGGKGPSTGPTGESDIRLKR
ncbi:MAG: serine/threonine protein kinase [Labilithrix sp.]|nr:serine/threonine protein kinase [Labilithrix sp.]MBX3220041.1 serine/threonine protein kinase [Labilithrix sp.]